MLGYRMPAHWNLEELIGPAKKALDCRCAHCSGKGAFDWISTWIAEVRIIQMEN